MSLVIPYCVRASLATRLFTPGDFLTNRSPALGYRKFNLLLKIMPLGKYEDGVFGKFESAKSAEWKCT